MTKTIFATLIAATALSNVALANDVVVPASGKCSEAYDQVSRFNPTELDDYGKCVALANDIEHGTVGNNVWFNIDGEFVYVPQEELRGAGNDEVREMVTTAYVTAMDAAMQAELNSLRATIGTLEAAGLDTSDVEAMIQGILSNARNSVTLVDADDVTVERGDSYSNVAGSYSVNIGTADQAYTPVDGDGFTGAGGAYYEFDDGVWYARPFQSAPVALNVPAAGNAAYVREINAWVATQPTTTVSTVAGVAVDQLLTDATITAINTAVQAAYTDGYTAGYDAGYNDGYQDGYADGFADGVASVQ